LIIVLFDVINVSNLISRVELVGRILLLALMSIEIVGLEFRFGVYFGLNLEIGNLFFAPKAVLFAFDGGQFALYN